MSYLQYLKLYTKKPNKRKNNRKVVKRGQKNNYWLHLLKINDKLDIYDGQRKGDKCWHIGTIIKIEKNDNNETKLLISYDGWRKCWDEWVNIDHSITISSKLKELNAITPYHDYLNNPTSMKPCKWTRRSEWKKCNVCDTKCCTKCCITKKDDKCKKCMKTINYQNLFNPIHSSIYTQYAFDINIIHLITEYATGITVQCSNTNKSCLNDINFETQYNMETNLGRKYASIYQYCPEYIHPGTITMFGKNRRIFCETCTKNELFNCSRCRSKEARGCDISSGVCHNHHFVECPVCKEKYDANGGCWYCKNGHCPTCVDVYCYKCEGCKFSLNILKCEECQQYICDECGKYVKCNECGKSLCVDCGSSCNQSIVQCKKCKKTSKGKQDDIDMDEKMNKSESEMNNKKRKLENSESPQPTKKQRTC